MMTVLIVSLGSPEVSRLKVSPLLVVSEKKGWTEARLSVQPAVVMTEVRSSLQKDAGTMIQTQGRNTSCAATMRLKEC
ncbi:hypothetical protein Tco_0657238 [Tanacetum coccineum]|uniref:Uncharacterized protein n=1 Tax=Tanacetum coccineum TaxID=301880 RepID=A0ABQ4XB26_9ASTR